MSKNVQIKYQGNQIFLDPKICGSDKDPLYINDQVTWVNNTDEDCTVTPLGVMPVGGLQLSPPTVQVPSHGRATATIVGAPSGINSNNYTCASSSVALALAANDSTNGVIIVDGPEVAPPKGTPTKESELVGANRSRR